VFSPKRIPNWYYSLGQLGTLERKSRHFFFFFLRSCPIGLSLVYLSLLTGRKRERERDRDKVTDKPKKNKSEAAV
jgi:hypothetical protein